MKIKALILVLLANLLGGLPSLADPLQLVDQFGSQGSGLGQFDSIGGVAVDSAGRFIVADSFNRRIQICTREGVCTAFGSQGSQPGQFCDPTDVAVDSQDRIIVTDGCNHRIQICDDLGNCSAFGSLAQFDQPKSVAVNSDDLIIVADAFKRRVQRCEDNGDCEIIINTSDPFGFIEAVAVDEQDRIFVIENLGGPTPKGLHYCSANVCELIRTVDLPEDVTVDRENRIFLWDAGALYQCDHAGRCQAIELPDADWLGPISTTPDNEIIMARDGVIRIFAPPPLFLINEGINDAWVNAGAPFQGLFINAFPILGAVFAAWFTFDEEPPGDDAMAVFGAADQRWVTGLGTIQNNRVALTAELTTGGVFNASVPLATQEIYGNIYLQFDSCSSGTVSYTFTSLKNIVSVSPIDRALPSNVALCEMLQP